MSIGCVGNQAKKPKRTPAIIFTANTTSICTWDGAPQIPGETARMTCSREMAARMLRKVRKEAREKRG